MNYNEYARKTKAGELEIISLRDLPDVWPPHRNWHRVWEFDREHLTLTCLPRHARGYWIALSKIRTSAQMLDWIMQIHSKRWANARILTALLDAFDQLFQPQATLCSGGASKTIDSVDDVIAYSLARLDFELDDILTP